MVPIHPLDQTDVMTENASHDYPSAQPLGASAAPTLSPLAERTWASAAHWSALACSLIGLTIVGPLLVLFLVGNRSPFVREHAIESVNAEITFYLALAASIALIIVLVGVVAVPLVLIAWLLLRIIASVRANNGEPYRYPLSFRFVS